MTGAGTNNDPYIVDNWEDFMSIDKSSTKYVKWADSDNKIIDFNDIKPDGYTTSIIFPADVDFNGWTLRNFHSTALTAIRGGSGSRHTIKNLIMENFYITSTEFIYSTHNLENCIFSGLMQNNGSLTLYVFHGCGLIRCAVNIVINSTSNIFFATSNGFSTYTTKIKDSDIVLDINNANSVEICSDPITNSRISGKISSLSQVKLGSSSSGSNVINIESNQSLIYTGIGISVYNSDLAEKSSDSLSTLKACTTEQLKNAEYLYSIGFPIGIE